VKNYRTVQKAIEIVEKCFQGKCDVEPGWAMALVTEIRRLQAEAELQSELTKAREELHTLKHAVWHALDDSTEDAQTGEVTIMVEDFALLSEMVPEEWHDEYHVRESAFRQDECNKLHLIISGPGDCHAAARRVYDAGYRQSTPVTHG
jgi:hypothetical protein